MATYTKVFADPYPNGWKSKPDLSTPYTTAIRDNHDVTLRSIEDYLYNNPIGDISNASIGDLEDVSLTGIQNGYVLAWDAATSKLIPVKPSSGGGGTSYSTDEIEVGTDPDGNPLYQKTIIETSLLGKNAEFVLAEPCKPMGGSSGVDTQILSFDGIIRFNEGNNVITEYPLNYIDLNTSNVASSKVIRSRVYKGSWSIGGTTYTFDEILLYVNSNVAGTCNYIRVTCNYIKLFNN